MLREYTEKREHGEEITVLKGKSDFMQEEEVTGREKGVSRREMDLPHIFLLC